MEEIFHEGDTVILTFTVKEKSLRYTTRILHKEGSRLLVPVPEDLDEITDDRVQIHSRDGGKGIQPKEGKILRGSTPGFLRIFCADPDASGADRREMFRIEDESRIEFCLLSADEHERLARLPAQKQNSGRPYRSGVVHDLSGAGVRFYTKYVIEAEAFVLFRLLVGEGGSAFVSGIAEVIRTRVLIIEEGKPLWEAAVHFTDMTPRDRDLIVSHILERQRAALAPG